MLNKKLLGLLVAGMVSLNAVGCESTVEEPKVEVAPAVTVESIEANVEGANEDIDIYEMTNEEGKLTIKLKADYAAKSSYVTFGEMDCYNIIKFLYQNNLLHDIDRIVISLVHPEDGSLHTVAVFNTVDISDVNFDMELQPIYEHAESITIAPHLR